MAESEYPTHPISLGPGGRITDPNLVGILEDTPILQPRELIKLAIYFSAFSTNLPLGEELWESALETMTTHPRIAPIIKQVFAVKILAATDDFQDSKVHHEDDDTKPEDTDIQGFLFAKISGIGLVIEKRVLDDEETAFFVVGVSPDPKDLPDPEDIDNPGSAPIH